MQRQARFGKPDPMSTASVRPTSTLKYVAQSLASPLRGQAAEQSSAPEVYLSLSLPGENLGAITSAANSWGVSIC